MLSYHLSPGGAVVKRSKSPIYRAIEAVDRNIYQRLAGKAGLQFVYDIVSPTTPFQKLRFTMNAGKKPLWNLDDENFLSVYGLQKKLTFKIAEPRETVSTDLWSILY